MVKNGEKSPRKSVWEKTTPGGLGALHKFFRTSTRQSAPCSMPCLCHAHAMPIHASQKAQRTNMNLMNEQYEQHSYDQLGQQRDLQTTTLVLVSAADLVIPHGTPVTTASLPKGGVRRDLSILGDGPDVGKNMKKCASNESGSGFHGFPYVKKHLLSQEVSFKGFKNLDSEFLMLHKCCKKCSNHQVSCLTI